MPSPQLHSWPRGRDLGAGLPPSSCCRSPPAPWDRGRAGGTSIAAGACPELSRLTSIAGGLAEGAAGLPVHGVRGRLSLSGLCWDRRPGPAPHKRGPWRHPLLLARAVLCLLVHLPLCSAGCYATAGSRCLTL